MLLTLLFNFFKKRIHGIFQYHPILLLTNYCLSGVYYLVLGSHWDSEIWEVQYHVVL